MPDLSATVPTTLYLAKKRPSQSRSWLISKGSSPCIRTVAATAQTQAQPWCLHQSESQSLMTSPLSVCSQTQTDKEATFRTAQGSRKLLGSSDVALDSGTAAVSFNGKDGQNQAGQRLEAGKEEAHRKKVHVNSS